MKIQKNFAQKLLEGLPTDPAARLMAWEEIQLLVKDLKVVEMTLRKEMCSHFVPKPNEGANTVKLGQDWKVTMTHTISREPDEAAFSAVFKELPRGFRGDLIKTKHSLIKSAYNKLSDVHRKIFDEALIIKPGSPALKLVAPKKK